MSIRFDCVGCNKSIVVHDRFEGRNVRCPTCSFELLVPKKQGIEDTDRESLDVDTFVISESVASVSEQASAMQSELESPVNESKEVEAKAKPKSRASRSIRKSNDSAEEDLEWDITPMVDVAFLLLIFFMLTASFSIQKVIRTTPPQSDQPSRNASQIQLEDKLDKIKIQIDEFNAYTVVFADGQTNEASSKQELITILKDFRLHAGEQLPRIIIQAHVDSFHGATVSCMDAARAAEFREFQLFAVENFD